MIKKILIGLFVSAAALCLSGCSGGENSEYVEHIKNCYPYEYCDLTYGEAFDSSFSSPSWKLLEVEEGNGVNVIAVEFSGVVHSEDEGDLDVEIVLYGTDVDVDGKDIAHIDSMTVNGEEQSSQSINEFAAAVFG